MAQPPPPPAGAIPAHVLNAPQFAFHVMTTKYPRNGPGPVAGVGGPAPPEPAAGDPLRIIYMFPEQQDGYVQGVFSPDAIKDYRPNINPTGPFNAQVEAIRQWVYAWETSVPDCHKDEAGVINKGFRMEPPHRQNKANRPYQGPKVPAQVLETYAASAYATGKAMPCNDIWVMAPYHISDRTEAAHLTVSSATDILGNGVFGTCHIYMTDVLGQYDGYRYVSPCAARSLGPNQRAMEPGRFFRVQLDTALANARVFPEVAAGGGNNPGGDNPGGDNPGGDNPGGNNHGGSNPGPSGNNPGGNNPGSGGSNPGSGGSNPGGNNPGGNNPGGNNPGGNNPGGNNPGGNNPGGNNLADDTPGDPTKKFLSSPDRNLAYMILISLSLLLSKGTEQFVTSYTMDNSVVAIAYQELYFLGISSSSFMFQSAHFPSRLALAGLMSILVNTSEAMFVILRIGLSVHNRFVAARGAAVPIAS